MRYKQTSTYNHDEVPARKSLKTGRFQELKKKDSTIPEGKRLVVQEDFSKLGKKCVPFLKKCLSHEEISIVFQMIGIAEYGTNSLKPLNNDTTIRELSEQFGVGKNQVNKYFKNLFDLGVYAQFKIAKSGEKEFWILNPHISFQGRTAEDSLYDNFKGTKLTNFMLNIE